MRSPYPGSLILAAALVLAGIAPAVAASLPIEENEYLPPEDTTTYKEQSLRRQGTLVIEHPYEGQRGNNSRAAIAGFCYDGGLIRRRDLGVVRQREVCENIAPRTLKPGDSEPRPRWTGEPSFFQPLLDIGRWFDF